MITIRRIKKHYGSLICRRCLNEHYGTKLRPADCYLIREVDVCPACEDKKRLVRRLTLLGYIKTIGK